MIRVPEEMHCLAIITIGNRYGIITWNDFVITGRLAPFMKKMIEQKTMDEMKNKTVARVMAHT